MGKTDAKQLRRREKRATFGIWEMENRRQN
jgi:hypothetical protein